MPRNPNPLFGILDVPIQKQAPNAAFKGKSVQATRTNDATLRGDAGDYLGHNRDYRPYGLARGTVTALETVSANRAATVCFHLRSDFCLASQPASIASSARLLAPSLNCNCIPIPVSGSANASTLILDPSIATSQNVIHRLDVNFENCR